MSSVLSEEDNQVEKDIKRQLHPTSQYYMRPDVGPLIAKGLAAVYKEKPRNPVDFLAKWLLLEDWKAKQKKKELAAEKKIAKLRAQDEYYRLCRERIVIQREKDQKVIEQRHLDFNEKMMECHDMETMLQDLVEYLNEFTGSTSTYIAKVCKPIKGIRNGLGEDEDEDAHIIEDSEDQLNYIYYSERAAPILEDKFLLQSEGVSFDLFREEVTSSLKSYITDEEDGLPKHLIIPQVVKNRHIKFFNVPRLGAFLAAKMEYSSCLNEDSYDEGLEAYIEMNKKIKKQQEKKKAWENEKAEKRMIREIDGKPNKNKEEDGLPEEAKQWEELNYKPFLTETKQFAVCCNTMG